MKLEQNDLLTIGDIAKAASTTPRTIRFYESIGLIKPLKRTKSGYRLFGREELHRLRLITSLKRAGFHLKAIQSLIDLKTSGLKASETARAANEILLRHIPDVDRTLASVSSAKEGIAQTMELLSRCYGCDEDFEKLPCGDCENWRDNAAAGLPMIVTLIWPKISEK
jgi:DNA-binding transcriptional MerR regulator